MEILNFLEKKSVIVPHHLKTTRKIPQFAPKWFDLIKNVTLGMEFWTELSPGHYISKIKPR